MRGEYSFVKGDLFDKALSRGFLRRPLGRILAIASACYAPQAALTLLDGNLFGASYSFLSDVGAIVQYLIAVPLMLFADYYIDPFIEESIAELRRGKYVHEDGASDTFGARTNAICRAATSPIAIAGCILISFLIAWSWILPNLESARSNPEYRTWVIAYADGAPRLSAAALFAGFFASPVFWFSILRWVWKALVWIAYLFMLSRFRLTIRVYHPDGMGGIGFLNHTQSAFGLMIFAIGCVVAATVGYNSSVKGLALMDYANLSILGLYIVLAPLVFLLPLLVFTKQLFLRKREGIYDLRCYAGQLSDDFESFRIGAVDGSRAPPSEEAAQLARSYVPLQTLSSLGQVFEAAERMRIVPFDLKSLGKLLLTSIGPMVPLIIENIPMLEPFVKVLQKFLGGGGGE
jgi:hypothetical protein